MLVSLFLLVAHGQPLDYQLIDLGSTTKLPCSRAIAVNESRRVALSMSRRGGNMGFLAFGDPDLPQKPSFVLNLLDDPYEDSESFDRISSSGVLLSDGRLVTLATVGKGLYPLVVMPGAKALRRDDFIGLEEDRQLSPHIGGANDSGTIV